MNKKSVILKVISVLMIIFGALSAVSSIMLFMNRKAIESLVVEGGLAADVPVSSYIVLIAVALIELAVGIAGIVCKVRKTVILAGIVMVLASLASLIYNSVLAGFNITNLVSFVLPVLYLWGAYQSEE